MLFANKLKTEAQKRLASNPESFVVLNDRCEWYALEPRKCALEQLGLTREEYWVAISVAMLNDIWLHAPKVSDFENTSPATLNTMRIDAKLFADRLGVTNRKAKPFPKTEDDYRVYFQPIFDEDPEFGEWLVALQRYADEHFSGLPLEALYEQKFREDATPWHERNQLMLPSFISHNLRKKPSPYPGAVAVRINGVRKYIGTCFDENGNLIDVNDDNGALSLVVDYDSLMREIAEASKAQKEEKNNEH